MLSIRDLVTLYRSDARVPGSRAGAKASGAGVQRNAAADARSRSRGSVAEPAELGTLRRAHGRLREHGERAPDLRGAVARRQDPAIGDAHRAEHRLEVGAAVADA